MKVTVIHNPVAAGAGDVRSAIDRHAVGCDVTWRETTEDDPGAGQARAAVDAGSELVVVCGGDGTVAACAGSLAGTGVAMAVVPIGTGNLLARNLGLPLDLEAALATAFGRDRRTIDVLEAGSTRFVVMAGLGLDAAMIRNTDDRTKARFGWAAYVVGGLRALRATPRADFEVCVDDGPARTIRGLGVLVGNVGRLQGGFVPLPSADPADGIVDVIVLAPRGVGGTLALGWQILRHRAAAGAHAEVLRGHHVEVRVSRAVPAEFDGEYAGLLDRLSISVLDGALTVCGAA